MNLTNETKGILLAAQVEIADSFTSRLAGLMLKRAMPPWSALVLTPCNSIHTFFMRFNIDAVFLDKEGAVVRVLRELAPYRFCFPVKGACAVVELLGGTVKDLVAPGHKLALRE